MPFNGEELEKIEIALKKLFSAQGKGIVESVCLDFLEEINKWPYPFMAVMDGIKSLYAENLREIKLFTIKQAVQNCIEPVQEHKSNTCPYCICGSGILSLREVSKPHYTAAFACTCAEGRKKALFPWSGKRNTIYDGRIYEHPDAVMLNLR